MKRIFTFLFSFVIVHLCSGQNGDLMLAPSIKVYNHTSFSDKSQKNISSELIALSDPIDVAHPEFGILPYDASCKDCSELISKRTVNSRYYFKNGSGGKKFYVQTCSNDLHFKNQKGEWVTIDPRLVSDPGHPGVYRADDQFNPTKLNLTEHYASIQMFNNWELILNKNTKLAHAGIADAITYHPEEFTAGDDGSVYKNAWNGIDLVQTFDIGAIKTDYIINNLNSVNAASDYLIIRESLNLPEGYAVRYDTYEGEFLSSGLWEGDLLVVDEFDREYARYSGIAMYDNSGVKSTELIDKPDFTGYKIIKQGDEFLVEIWVSTKWLLADAREFPITIDPLVTATTTWTGTIGSNFTPSFCSQIVSATMPANATFTNGQFDWQVKTGSGCAATCWLSDARIKISSTCGETPAGAFWWSCPSPACDFGGTWDPAPPVSDAVPVTCFEPSCIAYTADFTFKLLRVYNCGAASGCPTNCLKATRYDVTIEGESIEATALAGGSTFLIVTDCINQANWLTPLEPIYGVPGYTYLWSPMGSTDDSVYVSFPLGTTSYTLLITDTCGNTATDVVTVLNPCPTLPIELLSFSGYHYAAENYLNWTTASEENNKEFVVERSSDGLNFQPIGSVPGVGNSTQYINYEFIDRSPIDALNYYRLKQIDFNGDFSFSNTIAIKASTPASTELVVNHTDPVSGEVSITVFSPSSGSGMLYAYDIAGKAVFRHKLAVGEGATSVVIHPAQLASGMYILSFTKDQETATAKFIR